MIVATERALDVRDEHASEFAATFSRDLNADVARAYAPLLQEMLFTPRF